jgi:CheY-like chemotaxis protein
MFGRTIPQQKLPVPLKFTPPDDSKKIVSQVLKRVDRLIKEGDLELAQLEITKAKEVDPRNIYTFALEERITLLKAEWGSKEVMQPIEEPSKQLVRKTTTKTQVKPQMITTPSPPEQKPIEITAIVPPTKEEQTTVPPPPVVAPISVLKSAKPLQIQQEKKNDRNIELDAYRNALIEVWYDGALTPGEKRRIEDLRILLEITDDEHEQINQEIKYSSYRNALMLYLTNASVTPSSAKSLKEIQNMFHISKEEHLQIETELISTMQNQHRDKILVIDDDDRLLEILAALLVNGGFDVTALPTSDEAYALLHKFVPDAILCDINLATSTMGGFAFYEKVQELKNLQCIPFIFLSGLTDEALVRAGKELGVDDYLMKPISEQTLISTINGKLKRFKQLQKIIDT